MRILLLMGFYWFKVLAPPKAQSGVVIDLHADGDQLSGCLSLVTNLWPGEPVQGGPGSWITSVPIYQLELCSPISQLTL